MHTLQTNSIRALAVCFSLLVAGAASAAPPVNLANGGGTVDFNGARETIAFTAHLDAAGVAKGQAEFQLRDQNLTFHVDVDCLSVSGVNAWIAGVITTSSDPSRVGQRVLWQVQDNGEGGAAPPDRVSLPVLFSTAACGTQPPLPLVDWTNGNVQVMTK
jgi:hypothetical protein